MVGHATYLCCLALLRVAGHIVGLAQRIDQCHQQDNPVTNVQQLQEEEISVRTLEPGDVESTHVGNEQNSITQRSLPPFHPHPHAGRKRHKGNGKKVDDPEPWLMIVGGDGG